MPTDTNPPYASGHSVCPIPPNGGAGPSVTIRAERLVSRSAERGIAEAQREPPGDRDEVQPGVAAAFSACIRRPRRCSTTITQARGRAPFAKLKGRTRTPMFTQSEHGQSDWAQVREPRTMNDPA